MHMQDNRTVWDLLPLYLRELRERGEDEAADALVEALTPDDELGEDEVVKRPPETLTEAERNAR